MTGVQTCALPISAFQLDNLGDLIINTTTQGFGSPLGSYNFKNNQSQEIIIEFVHYNEDAYFSLSWQSLSTDFSLVPQNAFKNYQNITFTNLTISTSSVDPQESSGLPFFTFFIYIFFLIKFCRILLVYEILPLSYEVYCFVSLKISLE